jgi:hypothetical protein
MQLQHPLQKHAPETFHWLIYWSRFVFIVVLGLYAYIKWTTMPGKQTPDSILATPLDKLGALGFWAGYDYLFMAIYTFFFALCCVWAAGRFTPGSFFYNLGIVLAWATIPLLVVDMTENWCIWQISLGLTNPPLEQLYRFLIWPKEILFICIAAYAAIVQLLKWIRMV